MHVTSVESITAAQRAAIEQLGSVDVLVNNAAVLIGENDSVLSIPGPRVSTNVRHEFIRRD